MGCAWTRRAVLAYRISIRFAADRARHAPRLRRAPLPVQLHLPPRRVAPGGAGRARESARLFGAGADRRMLARGHGPRASRRPVRRPAAGRRRRVHARRRHEARALRDRPRHLRRSRAADHARAPQRGEGRVCAVARRCRGARAERPRAVAAAGGVRRRRAGPHRALAARGVRHARVDRHRPVRARRRPRIARALRDAVARQRAAAGGGRRRPHARARAAGAAGHADGDPAEDAALRLRLRAPSERRAAPALARAARHALSARAARRDGRARGALRLLARRAALRISRGDRPAGRDAGIVAAQAHRRGPRASLRLARCGAGRHAGDDRARARADRRAPLRALLPHRLRRRRLRALARHPLPGPRVRRQFGGLLRARHHRSRSRAHSRCCSSASSRRSATSRPTSTSTSSTSGARR